MTGKERVARTRRRRTLTRLKTCSLLLLTAVLDIVLLWLGITTEGSLGSTLLSMGAVLTTLVFLVLLWSIPVFLRERDVPTWIRIPLLRLAGADPSAGFIRAGLLQCFVLALLMTAAAVLLLAAAVASRSLGRGTTKWWRGIFFL